MRQAVRYRCREGFDAYLHLLLHSPPLPLPLPPAAAALASLAAAAQLHSASLAA